MAQHPTVAVLPAVPRAGDTVTLRLEPACLSFPHGDGSMRLDWCVQSCWFISPWPFPLLPLHNGALPGSAASQLENSLFGNVSPFHTPDPVEDYLGGGGVAGGAVTLSRRHCVVWNALQGTRWLTAAAGRNKRLVISILTSRSRGRGSAARACLWGCAGRGQHQEQPGVGWEQKFEMKKWRNSSTCLQNKTADREEIWEEWLEVKQIW